MLSRLLLQLLDDYKWVLQTAQRVAKMSIVRANARLSTASQICTGFVVLGLRRSRGGASATNLSHHAILESSSIGGIEAFLR